ncbi:pentapeptide repeat-containing protein [Nocardioides hankookensis]|uniref:Pentapeptide repeat-containing protein n=1 Tax=Nocardioides hankookensis TaxID=443157 RepID=A0ABW1LQ65_9ACTN
MPPRRTTTQQPQIDRLTLGALTEGDPAELRARADLEAVGYADLALPALDLAGGVVNEARFAGVSADETTLQGSRFVDVELEQVNLPVVWAARCEWRDVRVTGRLGSFEAYEAQWRSVHFVGCKISYLNLRGAELIDVAFTDCVVEELDLSGAVARRVALRGSRVGALSVQQARLEDVDLRGCELQELSGLLDLRGATISPDQLPVLAPLMAQGLGLRVEA